ncbi:uncharacterized protein LOC122274538 [Carya illinoinensis]|uniref:uncharacterized protein LOC122274538 n=1 Tax=Carya illinoinensis TaxID=32201 RepID=UPI001C71F74B|nr:uncharacterized protein LOC122274538 [Carya illinoinensis]
MVNLVSKVLIFSLFNRSGSLAGEHSGKDGIKGGFHHIWKMEVPVTVKTFIWKAIHEGLPTRKNLARRGVVDSALCPICKQVEETTCHVVWSCMAASDVWADQFSVVQKWDSRDMNFCSLWELLTTGLCLKQLEQVACVMRRIWLRQNQFIFEGKFADPKTVYSSVGTLKLNWDAGIEVEAGRMGASILVRDSTGEVIAVMAKVQESVFQPVLAELLALWRAVTFCLELGLTAVVFEGDAQSSIKEINSSDENCKWYGQILEDVKSILMDKSSWRVQYVSRKSNQAAHHLGKFALKYVEDEIVWMEEVPECIYSFIAADRQCNA